MAAARRLLYVTLLLLFTNAYSKATLTFETPLNNYRGESSYVSYPGQKGPSLFHSNAPYIFNRADPSSPPDLVASMQPAHVPETPPEIDSTKDLKRSKGALLEEKPRDPGYIPRVFLLMAYTALITFLLAYNTFDKFTGLGRAGGSFLLSPGRSDQPFFLNHLLSRVVESIDVAEIAFNALSIREEECKQLAFCNLRKVLNFLPQMEEFVNILGYDSLIKKRYERGNVAGTNPKTCKTAFPQCKYRISL